MGLRKFRRKLKDNRKNVQRRFERHRRANLLAEPGEHDFIVVLDHLKPWYNIGKIFRSADAFGAREIHLVGIEFFDPAPAMGSFKWVPAFFHKTFESCYAQLIEHEYQIFSLEPATGQSLPFVQLPLRCAFIFGHEELGLCFNKDDFQGIKSLKIPQLGKVQSLNVSVAASLVMYEYVRQHNRAFTSD